ncbi:hypothetical protein [Tenacibaculum maritimum]|uniref:hypothetical protein n=1 Tax=Tenacibaculum maritimum TaxID=107401 RepID=UPI0038765692
MNNFEIYETVKEFDIYVGDLSEDVVKARISKLTPKKGEPEMYFWFISHFYKPEKNAIDVYIPSKNYAISYEEVKDLLMKYVNGFTGIDVKRNKNF